MYGIPKSVCVGQEPAIAMHLALWYVVLVCHQYDVKILLAVCILMGMVV